MEILLLVIILLLILINNNKNSEKLLRIEEELKKIAEDELSYNEPIIIEEGVDNDDIEP
jgi:hypothetical protein